MSTYFGEQDLPGVVSNVDASGLSVQGQLAYGNIGIVGLAAAGEEDTVHFFTSSPEARQKLQGGAMLDAIIASYGGGARRIYAVRVGAPVAATEDFTASANADAVSITALNKGTSGNNIEVKIEEGATSTDRIYTFRHQDDYNQVIEVFDNGGDGYATVAAAKAAINASSGGSNIVSFDDDASSDIPDETSGYVSLASGTDGTRSNQEITDGLALLLNQNVDIMLIDSGDTTYHAILAAHCEEASNSVNKNERTGVVGMDADSTVSEYLAQASTLNNRRVVLVAPNIYTPDWGTNISTSSIKGGHVTAAMVAGLKAGLSDPAEPLTFKPLRYANKLEVYYSNTELVQLIEGNVLPLGIHRRGNRVIKQGTTSADANWQEWSVVTSIDFIMKDLRNLLEELYIGRKGTSTILALIEATVKGRLSQYTQQSILFSYFKDSVVADFLSGDQTFVNVSFTAVPIFPVNNIGIAATISSVYNFQLALQVQRT